MKNWGWKTWLMFGIFAVLLVGAIVGVAVGVLTEDDPTLLRVCWLPDGRAQYVESDLEAPLSNPACDEPQPLIWPSGDSLRVAIVSAADGSALDGTGDEELVLDAVELVNRQLSTDLTFTTDPDEADIVVTFRAAFEVGSGDSLIGGSCSHTVSHGRMRADLQLKPAGDIRTEYRRAIHELGHCLGLGHWIWGIMRTGDLDDSERDRMEFDRFGDGQVELMEATYP